MSGSVTIGEFARLTHLSVPALRHYHEVGLLEPATVDTSSRYRRYDVAQVATAQLIRRLRELEMPLPEVRAVLAAPDPATRDATVAAHLDRMEHRLAATRAAVASLRALLVGPPAAPAVQVRLLLAAEVLIIEDAVARPEVAGWCGVAFPELYLAAQAAGLAPTGPAGGLYSAEFFERDNGRIAAFLPVDREVEVGGRLAHRTLPAARAAVAMHTGDFTDIDRTYGALGSHVAEHLAGGPGPIREVYLVGPNHVTDPDEYRTEICWPLSAAS